jgi:hypothetical protein
MGKLLSTVGVALLAGIASFLGAAVGPYFSSQNEQEKIRLELVRYATSGVGAEQAAKNLLFWYQVGVLKLPKTEEDVRKAIKELTTAGR